MSSDGGNYSKKVARPLEAFFVHLTPRKARMPLGRKALQRVQVRELTEYMED